VDLPLARRRALRRDATDAEAAMWRCLRSRQLGNFKFRRQHPCGPFILDFFCPRARLAIELDGGQHYDAAAQAYDARRTAYLLRHGIRVIRFANDVVMRERVGVLEAIARVLGVAV
jgi:very-short-patch-repair endonuclease